MKDLADRFDISTEAVSQNFNTWILFLEGKLHFITGCTFVKDLGTDLIFQQSYKPDFQYMDCIS